MNYIIALVCVRLHFSQPAVISEKILIFASTICKFINSLMLNVYMHSMSIYLLTDHVILAMMHLMKPVSQNTKVISPYTSNLYNAKV